MSFTAKAKTIFVELWIGMFILSVYYIAVVGGHEYNVPVLEQMYVTWHIILNTIHIL